MQRESDPVLPRLLAAFLLMGGLREPRLAAIGEAAVLVLVWRGRPPLGPARHWLPWLAWAFLSALFSAQPFASLQFLARWTAVLGAFSMAAAWNESERQDWLESLFAASALLAVAALWTGWGKGFRGEMTGLIPPYYNYTTFALSAAVSAGASCAWHPRTAGRGLRAAGAAVAAVGSLALVLAHGRGAALGVVLALIVGIWRRRGKAAGLAALLAACACGTAARGGALPRRWQEYVEHHGGTYRDARLDIWRRASEIADESGALGTGPGGFGAAFRLHPVEALGGRARWGMNTDYAHSEPLQAAAETGWPGLALWLIALGSSFAVLIRAADDEPAREAAALAAVAMGAHLFVDNMLQIPALAMLFFASLAVAGAGPSGARWPRPAVVAGILLAAVGWIPRVRADRDPEVAAALYPRESYPREDLAYRAAGAGNLGKADELWAQAAERAPYDAVYPWRRAQIAAAAGRWADAESLARRAGELEPEFLDARVLRARALAGLGRRADADGELDRIRLEFERRQDRPGSSPYDAVIWDFDRKEFDRVSALVRGSAR